MSDNRTKEHSLTSFMQTAGSSRVVAPCVQVSLEPFVAHVNIRGNPQAPEFVEAVSRTLGQDLPQPGRVSRGDHAVYWLGPEEYLLVSHRTESTELIAALNREFAGLHAAATDLSGGQILMTVTGPAVQSFLSKASTLDLHATRFGVDDCAQSTFAKANALYALRDDTPTFELIVRRSFADYAARWMLQAGQEFGIVFNQ